MRVLLVNDVALGPGSGAEVHVARLAAALRDAGDEVAVFAGEVRHRGASRVLDVWDPSARRRLRRVAAEFAPDVVHHHNILRELSVSVVGAVPGVASVHTVHDWRLVRAHEGAEDAPRRSVVLAAKWAKGVVDRAVVRRSVDALIAVSAAQAARLRQCRLGPVSIVPYFTDPGDEPGPPGDDVVFAGQLLDHKGVDVLIAAFAAVADRFPGTTLRIAGGGPTRTALEQQAAALGARVRFEGVLDDDGVRRLLADARVVCVPSTRVTEGAPLIAMEGLLAGRPVVGTDSPAFRELLDDGDLGAIVGLRDPEALASALDRFLGDRAIAEKVGRRARDVGLERHATPNAVAAIRDIYGEAIARRA